ncbi:MAG: hypothetical protein AAF594_15010 [Bacteroidota bacterium]
MSEFCAEALHVRRDVLDAVGTDDPDLAAAVRRAAPAFAAELGSRLPAGMVTETALAIVRGEAVDAASAATAYARWLIARAMAGGTPAARVGAPFVDVEAAADAFGASPYPALAAFFGELGGAMPDRFPVPPAATFPLPAIGYADVARLRLLGPEAQAASLELDVDEADWVLALDEPDDVGEVLRWIEEAAARSLPVAVIVDGDL